MRFDEVSRWNVFVEVRDSLCAVLAPPLSLAKGAILLKEKESVADLTDEMSGVALRAEIKRRRSPRQV